MMKSHSRQERQTYLRSILLGTAIGVSLPLLLLLVKDFTVTIDDMKVLCFISGVAGVLLGSSSGRHLVQKRRQLAELSNTDSTRSISQPTVSLVCPQCGSPDARPESALTKRWLEPSRVCRHCQTLYLVPMKLTVAVFYMLGGLLMMFLAIAIIYRGWRFGIATRHAFLLESLFYIAGCAIAAIAWTPLRQGVRGLRRPNKVPN